MRSKAILLAGAMGLAIPASCHAQDFGLEHQDYTNDLGTSCSFTGQGSNFTCDQIVNDACAFTVVGYLGKPNKLGELTLTPGTANDALCQPQAPVTVRLWDGPFNGHETQANVTAQVSNANLGVQDGDCWPSVTGDLLLAGFPPSPNIFNQVAGPTSDQPGQPEFIGPAGFGDFLLDLRLEALWVGKDCEPPTQPLTPVQ